MTFTITLNELLLGLLIGEVITAAILGIAVWVVSR